MNFYSAIYDLPSSSYNYIKSEAGASVFLFKFGKYLSEYMVSQTWRPPPKVFQHKSTMLC
jgi:hypothetical protein